MPKKAYLAEYLSSFELQEKYLKSRDSVEARRWHLLWKISLGWTIKNSAIAVGCSYVYAQKILSRYNLQGEEGVKNRKNQTSNHVRGKKRLLSQPQLEKLIIAIENKPPDGGIWTGTKVARWIEKETGKDKIWNQRGWDYLKKCNYSWQSPRPTPKKADKLEQEIFKNSLPLKLKKLEQENPDLEVELWFFDEHRVGLKPILKSGCDPASPKGARERAPSRFGQKLVIDQRRSYNIAMNGCMFMDSSNQRREKLCGI